MIRWKLAGPAIGCLLVAVFVFLDRNSKQYVYEPVEIDPRIEAIIDQAKRCPKAKESFGWICGLTTHMPGPHISQQCTSKERPYFSGVLNLSGRSRAIFSQSFAIRYALPLYPLVPCSEGWPEKTNKCALLNLYPSTNRRYGVFAEVPPDELPNDFPVQPYVDKGHTLAPDFYAKLDGEPVVLFYTRWIGTKPGAAPGQCLLDTRISSLNIGMNLVLPCAAMEEWRTELRHAVRAVKRGVVLEDQVDNCETPPENVVLNVNRFSTEGLLDLAEWLNANR